jgi:carbohydrate-selective porin OprB
VFNVSEVFNLNLGFTFGADSYRLYQLLLEQSLFNDKVNIAAGRMATLTEFANLDVLGYYVNTALNENAGSIKKNIPTIRMPTTTALISRLTAALFGLERSATVLR